MGWRTWLYKRCVGAVRVYLRASREVRLAYVLGCLSGMARVRTMGVLPGRARLERLGDARSTARMSTWVLYRYGSREIPGGRSSESAHQICGDPTIIGARAKLGVVPAWFAYEVRESRNEVTRALNMVGDIATAIVREHMADVATMTRAGSQGSVFRTASARGLWMTSLQRHASA